MTNLKITCTTCGEIFNGGNFYPHKKGKHSLFSICKTCHQKNVAAYRAHPGYKEVARVKMAQYRLSKKQKE